MGKSKNYELPDKEQLKRELKRVKHNSRFRKLMRSTIYTLIVVAACAVLTAVIFLPVLRIYGSSMEPTLNEGEIVVSVKGGGSHIKQGDVVGVYYGNKVLVKRCIATEYQWVDIDDDGYVYVDGKKLDEPYVYERDIGQTDIKLPYQVPDNTIFVMGDHRKTSVDSRNTSVGCIKTEDVVGQIVFRVWPFEDFGFIEK